jgi:hypothetical protein
MSAQGRKATPGGAAVTGNKMVRTFTATPQDVAMLASIARYHGFSKSGTLTWLVRKEFWRVFPAGNRMVRPDRGARVIRGSHDR